MAPRLFIGAAGASLESLIVPFIVGKPLRGNIFLGG